MAGWSGGEGAESERDVDLAVGGVGLVVIRDVVAEHVRGLRLGAEWHQRIGASRAYRGRGARRGRGAAGVAALAIGARATAPPIATAANHGARYLMVFMMFSCLIDSLFGLRRTHRRRASGCRRC